MTTTVSQAIAKQIEAHGTERVYQVPGESFLGLLDALRDSEIQLVTARQEGGAGWMALAEARLTGKAGVAMVTRGPGAANAQIAIHTAYQDGTPLVLFVGLIPTQDRDRDAFQEFDLRAWFGSTAKAVMILDSPDTVSERVARAFEIAESGLKGPVVIGLPEEQLPLSTSTSAVTVPRRRAGLAPDVDSLSSFSHTLNGAQRPVFVVGGDYWNEEASGLLREIAERADIPVVSDFRGHDIFPHSSPAWAGMLGFGRGEGAREAYDEADFVCYLGASRTDVLSDNYTLGGNESHTVIVSPDAELRAHVGRLDLHFTLSPHEWLAALVNEELVTTSARNSRLEHLRALYQNWSTPAITDPDVVSRETVFAEIARQLPNNSLITAGAGNYALGPLRYLHHERPRTFIGPRNGAMGGGVPGAVAVSLARPDQTVFAFAGDGCFGMNGQELAVLKAYGARAIVVVIDNAGYGTIMLHQERDYPSRPAGTYLENPDYVQLAEAHGIVGHRVDTMDRFPELLTQAIESDRSTLFHIVLPRIAEGTGLGDGTGLDPR